jgi:hypothetical protein
MLENSDSLGAGGRTALVCLIAQRPGDLGYLMFGKGDAGTRQHRGVSF